MIGKGYYSTFRFRITVVGIVIVTRFVLLSKSVKSVSHASFQDVIEADRKQHFQHTSSSLQIHSDAVNQTRRPATIRSMQSESRTKSLKVINDTLARIPELTAKNNPTRHEATTPIRITTVPNTTIGDTENITTNHGYADSVTEIQNVPQSLTNDTSASHNLTQWEWGNVTTSNSTVEKSLEFSENHSSRHNYSDVVTWEGIWAMDDFMRGFFKGADHCRKLDNHTSRPLLLNITFSCKDLFEKSGLGTGNFLTGIYGLRVTARVYEIDLMMSCTDSYEERSELILPHMMGFFPWNTTGQPLNLTKSQVCQKSDWSPMGYLLDEMTYEMRRVALAAVGPEDLDMERPPSVIYQLPDTNFTETDPVYKDVELDESVIHFRCGGKSVSQ